MFELLLADAAISRGIYVIVVGLTAFLLLLLVVAMWERRFSRPYVAIPEADVQRLSPYVRRMSDDVQAAGFVFGGYVGHAKPSIMTRGTVWFSSDGRTVVVTSSGTVSGIRTKQTLIFSPLNDGTLLCTTDQTGESDPSGMLRFKRRWNSLFPGLWELHKRRQSAAGAGVMRFREANAFDALTQIYDRRTHQMVDKGLARFINADEVCWRHTFLGALHICGNFFVQLGQVLPQFWRKYLRGAGSPV
ncbi:MAG: hypothetical protein ABSB74_14085 [Tepidisphaeraceae bacterium]